MLELFTEIAAQLDCKIKNSGRGRACFIKQGDKFVVTNASHNHLTTIKIDRKSTAKIGTGYALTPEQFKQIFTEV